MERIVKGIWIPIEIWEDKNLSWNERILLIEIDSFTSQEKDCYVSNEYIANLLNVNETYANKVLSSLIKKGYVSKTSFDGRKRYVKSNISISCKADLHESAGQGCTKVQGRLAEKCNIPNTDTDNNILNKEIDTNVSKKKDEVDFKEIVNYWNEHCADYASVNVITEKRKTAIKKLIKNNHTTVDEIKLAMDTLADADPFWKGENDKNWKASFDWFVNDTKGCFARILEGEMNKNGAVKIERTNADGWQS